MIVEASDSSDIPEEVLENILAAKVQKKSLSKNLSNRDSISISVYLNFKLKWPTQSSQVVGDGRHYEFGDDVDFAKFVTFYWP